MAGIRSYSNEGVFIQPRFSKEATLNIYHTQIEWNRYTGLFTVYDDWMDLVGYISQNGHVLFED